jgi:hypothetical protein
MSIRTADGPERGRPFTASLWTEIEGSAEQAAQTASPIPPGKELELISRCEQNAPSWTRFDFW